MNRFSIRHIRLCDIFTPCRQHTLHITRRRRRAIFRARTAPAGRRTDRLRTTLLRCSTTARCCIRVCLVSMIYHDTCHARLHVAVYTFAFRVLRFTS